MGYYDIRSSNATAKQMAIDMRSILSKQGQEFFKSVGAVRRINRWLIAAAASLRQIYHGHLAFRLAHAHVGKGVYPAGYYTGMHSHVDLQVEYLLFGRAVVQLSDGPDYLLQAGRGVLLPGGTEHALSVEEPTGILGMLVQVSGDGVPSFVKDLQECCRGNHSFLRSESLKVWSRQTVDMAGEGPRTDWELEALSELLRLWVGSAVSEILAMLQSPSAASVPGHPNQFRQDALCERALKFIRSNVSRPIRAEDVARDLGISTRHLNRLCRSAFSETATQAILRQKMMCARDLLREDPRMMVKEAASAVGYDSPAYFSYCFRRFYGYPPTDVKRD